MDTNGTIAALLRDLASVQTSQHGRWGYKRAAAAIRNLEAPIESFLQADGTLRKIPHVGPSSNRVIMEVLNTGHSEIVERQIAASDNRSRREPRPARPFSDACVGCRGARRRASRRPDGRAIPRRPANTFFLERRQPDTRRDHRNRHRPQGCLEKVRLKAACVRVQGCT
jgi:hypothetical protein